MSEQIAASPLLALSRQLQQLAEGAATSIVSIRSHGRAIASGFAWRPNIIVTASDALGTDDEITVSAAGDRSIQAQFAGRDPTTDIAVLRLAEDLNAPTLVAPTQAVGIGQMVLSLGRGREGMIANLGCVSIVGDAWQSQRGGRIDSLIRLDLRLDRQAEGGLVVDSDGRALGMPVFGPRRKPLIIPMSTIERIAPMLLADGRIRRGYLGVGVHPVRLDEAFAAAHALSDRRAAMIVSIDPDGGAGKAGVLLGDIILSFDGEPVAGLRSLFARLSPETVGKAVKLKLLRGGQIAGADVTIGASPAP